MTNTPQDITSTEQPGWRAREVWTGTASEQSREVRGLSLLSCVPMLGWSCWDAAQVQGLDAHCHPTHEICLIADGQVTWWVEDTDRTRETVTLRRGDGFVTGPGESHGGVDTLMHPCELYWLQVDLPVLLSQFADDAAADALRSAFVLLSPRQFRASPDVRSAFQTLIEEHRLPSPLGRAAAHAALLGLLVRAARDRWQVPLGDALSPRIGAALRWMRERLTENFSIEAAAARAGMTPPRFHERFLAEVGLSPGEWRSRERVARAEHTLRTSEATVTDIALSLGFPSSQYFATAFKRYTGQTPTAFRARFDTAPPR